MMFPIDYNGDVLNHNARVVVDGGIVESTDFLADFSEQTKRVNMPLLLDIYPNAAAAYSLRKLRTAYTGSAIRVRRSSDNTETDIGFNNAGDLDTSALATFVGNGNGFVSTWYDQSGNNRNATQTTQADQPQIVRNGLILTVNSKPCIYPLAVAGMNMGFNDSNLGTVNKHIFVVADTTRGENNTINYQSVLIASYSGSGSIGNDFSFSYYHGEPTIRLRNYDGSSFVLNSGTTSGYKIWQTIRTSSLLYIADNNNPYTVGGTPNTVYNSNTYRIGGHVSAGANNSPKLVQEVIYYPSNQSPNRIGIETNINSYYRIYQQEALLLDYYPDAAAAYSLRKLRSGYTGAAIQVRRSSDNAVQNIGFDSNGGLDTTALTTFVGTGNTGFVTTWYDQSGSGNNLISTGTTQQPTIVNSSGDISVKFDGVNDGMFSVNPVTSNQPISNFAVFKNTTWKNRAPIFGASPNAYVPTGTQTGIQSFDVCQIGTANQLRIGATGGGGSNFETFHILPQQTILNKYYSTSAIFNTPNFSFSLNTNNITGTSTSNSVTLSNSYLHVGSAFYPPYGFTDANVKEVIWYFFNQSPNRIGIEANINSYYNIYVSENDAQSFIDAAAITNSTQRQAINKLVYDLKAYGLWYKMKAIYPFVGGTADSHKFNLKDPRDVDGAFRLVFSGGWTHSATGAKPNGTTGWANTFYNAQNNFNTASANLSYYSRTSIMRGNVDSALIGASNGTNVVLIRNDYFNFSQAIMTNGVFAYRSDFTPSSVGSGFWLGNRLNNTPSSLRLWRNGVIVGTAPTLTDCVFPNLNLYLGGLNVNNSAGSYSDSECAFATIGDGLTDTEAANLYTAVQTFQTTLGRQV